MILNKGGKNMQMTFRWFGKDLDTVSLEQIKQIPGVVGVVPALHYLRHTPARAPRPERVITLLYW